MGVGMGAMGGKDEVGMRVGGSMIEEKKEGICRYVVEKNKMEWK
jgi:hypothetical protein